MPGPARKALWFAAACAVLIGRGQAPAARAAAGPDDEPVRIEWKSDWDATYSANRDRWRKELQQRKLDRVSYERQYSRRIVALLEALIAKYPDESRRRGAAYLEMGDHMLRLRRWTEGLACLDKAIAAAVGDAKTASRALYGILHAAGRLPDGAGEERVEQAARRMIALQEIGLPADGDWIDQACEALYELHLRRGRLLEAGEVLTHLPAGLARQAAWRERQARLYGAAGHGAEMVGRLEDLLAEGVLDGHVRGRLHEEATRVTRSQSGAELRFPQLAPAVARWLKVRSAAPEELLPAVRELLASPAARRSSVALDRQSLTTLWVAADRRLAALAAEALAPLRRADADDAELLLLRAGKAGGAAALLEVFRRYPYAAAAHEALVDYGERMLRQAQPALAARAFRDVLSRAAEADLRRQAIAGLGLSEAAGRTPASQPALDVSKLPVREVRVPPTPPWPTALVEAIPHGLLPSAWGLGPQLQAVGDGVLAAGPNLLAWFEADSSVPAWVRTPRFGRGICAVDEERPWQHFASPGPFQPAVVGERIYSRWGVDRTGRYATDLAAFDRRSGRMLWTTAAAAPWAGLWPISDPTFDEARLYVLTINAMPHTASGLYALGLVCLDAAGGRVIWGSHLADVPVPTSIVAGWGFDDEHADLVRYGSSPTVSDGAVYCQTNAGLVARCDARDGLVEWARLYARTTPGRFARRHVNRRGGPPVVAGRAVLFAPRDCHGVLAVERESGAVLWDRPFVASQDVAGAAGGMLVVSDDREVTALDTQTGRVGWQRWFPHGLRGRAAQSGGAVCIGTDEGLCVLDGRTGRTRAVRPWGPMGPMVDFVIGRGGLVGITDRSVTPRPHALGQPLNPDAPPRAPGLALPLRRTWHVARPNPRLYVPPPEAGLDGRVLLMSQGLLESVQATPRGAIDWQRRIAPGVETVVWAPKMLILVYPDVLEAVDAATGAVRWRRPRLLARPRRIVAGPYLFAYQVNDEADFLAVDLATGRLLWRRSFRDNVPTRFEPGSPLVTWDGRNLLIVGYRNGPSEGYGVAVCRPSDGQVTEVRSLLPPGTSFPSIHAVAGRDGAFLTDEQTVYRFSLAGPQPRMWHHANLDDLIDPASDRPDDYRARRPALAAMELARPWIRLEGARPWGKPEASFTQWFLSWDDGAYVLRRTCRGRAGVLVGDKLYEPAGRRLTVVDLRRRREAVNYVVPVEEWVQRRTEVLHFRAEGGVMFVVSGRDRWVEDRREPDEVRVDAFDAAGGAHRAAQVIREVTEWRRLQAADAPGVLLLADGAGLHAYVAGEADPPEEEERPIIYRRPDAAEAAAQPAPPTWTADAPDGRRGRLAVTHDGERLHLHAAYPDARLTPRIGRGEWVGGDWLEVGIATNRGSFRFGLGVDERGKVVWEDLGPQRLPGDRRAAVAHNLATGMHTYDVSLPLGAILLRPGPGWQSMGLSAAVWERDGPDGQNPLLAWGGGLSGPVMLRRAHRWVYLHPLSGPAEKAALDLIRKLPDLAESRRLLGELAAIHGASPRGAAAFYGSVLKGCPAGRLAEEALVRLDQALRRGAEDDPSAAVLKLAEQAGVDAAIRRRYRLLAGARLSQWVRTDADDPPRMLMLGVRGPAGSMRRVSWGDFEWSWLGEAGTASRRLVPHLPDAGVWRQLRVPLIWLDLQEAPICGLSFGQQGGTPVVWDRSAVVLNGKEAVFLDDSAPGPTDRAWDWVDRPVHSGTRAHTWLAGMSGEAAAAQQHAADFSRPVVAHVPPPATGAVLSVWVRPEAAQPPERLALTVYDERGDGFRATWGAADAGARFMGDLPPAGAWHELRVALAWTAFLDRPIAGIGFEAAGGAAAFDRAAVIAAGRRRVLIDDETPPGRAAGTWRWVDEGVKSGRRAWRLAGGERPAWCEVRPLKEPVADHLAFDPAEAMVLLERSVPALGASAAAKAFFDAMVRLEPPDPKRRAARCEWFLQALPAHPQAPQVLADLLALRRQAGEPDPVAAVDAAIRSLRLPQRTRYAFRRTYLHPRHEFIRTWQVVGPFAGRRGADHDTPYGPELMPVSLAEPYELGDMTIGWRPYVSSRDHVDMADAIGPMADAAAYAACWVEAPTGRLAVAEIAGDGALKVWVNRRLVFAGADVSDAPEGSLQGRFYLRRGWNEVLVKATRGEAGWGFLLQLVDGEGRGPMRDVKVAIKPP